MKKILYILSLAVFGITMCSCSDDYESYEEKRDYERAAISRFIDNPTCGEIKGKKINVISEEEFLKDTAVVREAFHQLRRSAVQRLLQGVP